MRGRHAHYFAALTERLAPDTRAGPDQRRCLDQLDSELDNLRAAFEWSLDGADIILGLRMAGALGYFWFRQGQYGEGQRWITLALEKEQSVDAPAPIRAALLHSAGVVAHYSYESEKGKQMLRESLALYRRLDDEREIGWVLIYLGAQSIAKPEAYEDALMFTEEGLSVLRHAGDRAGVAQALHVIGELSRHHGDYDKAEIFFEEGLLIAREIGDVLRQVFILDGLEYVALSNGEPDTAAMMTYESLALTLDADYRPHLPAILVAMAAVSIAQDKPQRAGRLLGAADALFEAREFSPRPSNVPDVSRTRASVRDRLDDDAAFEAAWAEGQAMTLEQAVAYALDDKSLADLIEYRLQDHYDILFSTEIS